MAIDRYDHYGRPRLTIANDGHAYLIRDVLDGDGEFSGICEFAVYDEHAQGVVVWRACKEGVEFSEIRPFLHKECVV